VKQFAYRLTHQRYQNSAYSGIGSLRANGRWHRAGISVVYTAESPATALLEILVHVERVQLMIMPLVVVPCHFDSELVHTLENVPEDWRTFPWPASTQQIGQQWFEERWSPVLEVPSAVVPSAKNFLLNPEHPQFGEIAIGHPQPFEVDPRLGR
jgi:RES domain-containing protein